MAGGTEFFKQNIAGEKIVGYRKATTTEAANMGFFEDRPDMIILSNGYKIAASMDDEGNGPGVFFALDNKGRSYTLYVPSVQKIEEEPK